MNLNHTFALTALLVAAFASPSAAEEGHDRNGQDAHKQVEHAHSEAATRIGDPYPLSTDPVTDQSLAEVQKPAVLLHEGRELRFASTESVETFNGEPQKYLEKVDAKIIESQMPYYPMTACPVSGDKLGGEMGEPVDYVYGNRLIRLCCKGCKGDFLKDPSATLEKLDAAVIAQQKEEYPLETCPVSGQKLGSMGEPVDVVVANRLVRLCCAGCKGKLMANPSNVLAQIDAASEASDQKGDMPSAAGMGQHGEYAGETSGRSQGDGHGSHDHDH